MITRLYRMGRGLYRLIPHRFHELGPLRRFAERVTAAFAPHDDVYTAEFYRQRAQVASKAGAVIAKSIDASLHPSKVVDVGCGTGDLLESLAQFGCHGLGLECAQAALEICRSKGVNARTFDIETDSLPADIGHCDVVVCLEVAEHLPERAADRLVGMLTQLSSTVVFGAATPGQGGHDHVNEQPHEYWITKFEALGYHRDQKLVATWQAAWEAGGIPAYYYRNLMIFRRGQYR